jgi:hypothetical protein
VLTTGFHAACFGDVNNHWMDPRDAQISQGLCIAFFPNARQNRKTTLSQVHGSSATDPAACPSQKNAPTSKRREIFAAFPNKTLSNQEEEEQSPTELKKDKFDHHLQGRQLHALLWESLI